jgi:RNA polymerase sigma-70 factor (ECF subfamily)
VNVSREVAMPGSTRYNATARPVDEPELVARAIEKDERAVRAIIQRYNRRLYRLARSVLRDDGEAEDVLQDAYLRAFTGLRGFRGEASLGTWLSRIVLNEALARLRRRRPTVALDAAEQQPPAEAQIIPFPSLSATDPERGMAQREIHAMLERAIDDLPDAFRTVLVARLIEDMSIEETAELLDLRPETVKTRLHRARALLRRALERHIGSALIGAFPFDGRRCARVADAVVARLCLFGPLPGTF